MTKQFPWIAKQNWEHILFMHWSIPKKVLEKYIPQPLELDTFDNRAWLTIVTFRASKSHFRFTPSWICYPPFTQINVRTYVRLKNTNETGVFFFSINVNSLVGTIGGSYVYGLPFICLKTSFNKLKCPLSIQYDVFDNMDTLLSVNYLYNQAEKISDKELTEFLTERYTILTIKGNKIIKIPVTHTPWEVEEVEVQFNKISDKFLPCTLSKNCTKQYNLAHYSSFKQTKLHPYETIGVYD